MTENEERIGRLFDELVPTIGKAESLAGELIRATARIMFRFYNDGDQVGIGYGRETCNPAARFLIIKGSKEVSDLAASIWGIRSETAYRFILDVLAGAVADYVESHPELRTTPTTNMWDMADPFEDVDNGWEDGGWYE